MSATRALVLAEWQHRWNREWRFSKVKLGLVRVVLQLSLAALILWRLEAAAFTATPVTAVLLVLLQQGLGGLMGGFLNGRETLYQRQQVTLLHLSTAPPQSLLIAQALIPLPARAWGALVTAVALAWLLPGYAARFWLVPVLWLAGVTAGVLGRLAGILALAGWVRLSPRTLPAVWAALLLLNLALMLGLIYLLAVGFPAEAISELLSRGRPVISSALLLFVGLPGLLMLLRLLTAAGRVGADYRQGWLTLREVSGTGERPRRYWFLTPAPGAAGWVLGRELLRLWYNFATWFRLGAWGLVILAVAALKPELSPGQPQTLLTLGIGVGAAIFVWAEPVAALFTNDGATFRLYVISGVRPAALLLGKLLAGLPFPLLAAAGAWAAAATGGAEGGTILSLTLTGGAIGLGTLAVTVGLGAATAVLTDDEEPDRPPLMTMVWEQVPGTAGGWAAFGGGAAFAAAGLWTAGAFGTAPPPAPAIWGLCTLALAALGAGYLRLRHLLNA